MSQPLRKKQTEAGIRVRDYEKYGEVFYLPDNFEVEQLPDWRIAVFSVTFPLHEGIFADYENEFFDPTAELRRRQSNDGAFGDDQLTKIERLDGASWKQFRTKGIRQFVMPTQDPKKKRHDLADERSKAWSVPQVQEDLRAPKDDLNNEGQEYRHYLAFEHGDEAPKVFYESASRRYTDVVGGSVGAEWADQSDRNKQSSEFEEKQRAAFYSIDFTKAPTFRGQATKWRTFGYQTSPRDNDNHEYTLNSEELKEEFGSVMLKSLDFSQFEDPAPMEFGATDEDKSGSLNSCKNQTMINRFLTLTVVAENVDSDSLNAISRALNRPRNTVWLGKSDFEATSLTINDSELLQACMEVVYEAFVQAGLITPSKDKKKKLITRSSVIELGIPRTGSAANAHIPQMQPIRSVVALPYIDEPRLPDVYRKIFEVKGEQLDSPSNSDQRQPSQGWSARHIWSWILATGTDNFVDGVPDFYAEPPEDKAGHFLFWDTISEETGVAFVRKVAQTRDDLKYFGLAHTRYVDLIMLVMRAHVSLAKLSGALREIEFTDVINVGERSEKKYMEKLNLQVKNFQSIQAHFVRIRDRLWVDAVPKYHTDTRVMRSIRKATDLDIIYRDIENEITLRQDIYSNIYEARRNEHQEKEHERFNFWTIILAFLAAVLAVPGFLDISSEEPTSPRGAFIISLELGAALMVVMFVLQRFLQKRWPILRNKWGKFREGFGSKRD